VGGWGRECDDDEGRTSGLEMSCKDLRVSVGHERRWVESRCPKFAPKLVNQHKDPHLLSYLDSDHEQSLCPFLDQNLD
jgi:hypothetical protein